MEHYNNPNTEGYNNNDYNNFLQYNNNYNNGGSNPLGAIYVSNIPPPQQQQQAPPQQQFDQHGQPIKIRKKPGRKPNPASPALRKAQNRAAQRAFRERKERHLKDLEGTIRQLRDQRNSAVKELNQTKSKMDAFRAENWYLKGVVLTLQFVCLHHNIHIPTHSPYLTEEALSDMAKTTPHAIEAYVNAYTKNNINLKPTMAAHFANSTVNDSPPMKSHADYYEEKEDEQDEGEEEMMDELEKQEAQSEAGDYIKMEEDEMDETMSQWVKQHEAKKKSKEQQEEQRVEKKPDPNSISAIQHIRLQLRVQSTISNVGKSAARLQPTILQLAIPHDPRIDLVPTPHMRDRMIIFRDQMDYDRCFDMLLNGAVYHGGDPTMSASWELPAEFFIEFWYLAINYDVTRTNTWRRLKGLPEIQPSTLEKQHQMEDNASDNNTVWTDDVFAQMTAGMPTLQPLDTSHLSSGFDFGSPTSVMLEDPNRHLSHYTSHDSHPLFEQLLNDSSRQDRSPSIGAMMDLMNSLSTELH